MYFVFGRDSHSSILAASPACRGWGGPQCRALCHSRGWGCKAMPQGTPSGPICRQDEPPPDAVHALVIFHSIAAHRAIQRSEPNFHAKHVFSCAPDIWWRKLTIQGLCEPWCDVCLWPCLPDYSLPCWSISGLVRFAIANCTWQIFRDKGET